MVVRGAKVPFAGSLGKQLEALHCGGYVEPVRIKIDIVKTCGDEGCSGRDPVVLRDRLETYISRLNVRLGVAVLGDVVLASVGRRKRPGSARGPLG